MPHRPSPWDSQPLTGLALVTTGIDPSSSELCGYAMVTISGQGQITTEWSDVVSTSGPIPESATHVHGITTELAQSPWAQRPDDAAERLASAVRALPTPLVAFNAPWVFNVLNTHLVRYGAQPISPSVPLIDPLVLDHKCQHQAVAGNRTLPAVRGRWNLPPLTYGPAATNAYGAVSLASTMIHLHPRFRGSSPVQLAQECAHLYYETEVERQDYRRENGQSVQEIDPWPAEVAPSPASAS